MLPYARREEAADLGTTCGKDGTLGGLRRINDIFVNVSLIQPATGPDAWLYPTNSCYRQTDTYLSEIYFEVSACLSLYSSDVPACLSIYSLFLLVNPNTLTL